MNKRFYLLTEIFRQPTKIEKFNRLPTKIENFNRLPTKLMNFNRQPTSGPPPPPFSLPETVNNTTETVPYNGTNHFNFTLFVNHKALIEMVDVQD